MIFRRFRRRSHDQTLRPTVRSASVRYGGRSVYYNDVVEKSSTSRSVDDKIPKVDSRWPAHVLRYVSIYLITLQMRARTYTYITSVSIVRRACIYYRKSCIIIVLETRSPSVRKTTARAHRCRYTTHVVSTAAAYNITVSTKKNDFVKTVYLLIIITYRLRALSRACRYVPRASKRNTSSVRHQPVRYSNVHATTLLHLYLKKKPPNMHRDVQCMH